jgi:hypothetical protein
MWRCAPGAGHGIAGPTEGRRGAIQHAFLPFSRAPRYCRNATDHIVRNQPMFWEVMRAYPWAFLSTVALPRRGRDRRCSQDINRSMLRVDTRKWLMARMTPKKYGDRLALPARSLVTSSTSPDPVRGDMGDRARPACDDRYDGKRGARLVAGGYGNAQGLARSAKAGAAFTGRMPPVFQFGLPKNRRRAPNPR